MQAKIFALPFVLLILVSCANPSRPIPSHTLAITPVPSGKSVVILLHGWGGDETETWGQLPGYLDEALRQRDMYVRTYSYPSGIIGDIPAIDQIVQNLDEGLNQHCNDAHEYIFVAHSMGGLVAKEYVLSYLRRGQSDKLKVSQVIFIATPHTGNHIARLADLVVGIPKAQIRAVRGLDEYFLRTQVRDWQDRVAAPRSDIPTSNKKSILHTSIYATNDRVVTSDIGTDRISDAVPVFQDEFNRPYDHTSLVKPQSFNDPVLKTIINRIKGRNGGEDRLSSNELEKVSRANRQFESDEYSDCAETLKPLVHEHQTNAMLHERYGTCLGYAPNRRKEGIHELLQAIKLKPDYMEAHANLAVTYLEDRNYEEAENHANEVLKYTPSSSRAKMLLAWIADHARKSQDAKRYYSAVIAENGDYSEWAFLKRAIMTMKYDRADGSSTKEASTDILRGYLRSLDRSEKAGNAYFSELCDNLGDVEHSLFPLSESDFFRQLMKPYANQLQKNGCKFL